MGVARARPAPRSTKNSLASRSTRPGTGVCAGKELASAPATHAPAADMQAPSSNQCPLVYSHSPSNQHEWPRRRVFPTCSHHKPAQPPAKGRWLAGAWLRTGPRRPRRRDRPRWPRRRPARPAPARRRARAGRPAAPRRAAACGARAGAACPARLPRSGGCAPWTARTRR